MARELELGAKKGGARPDEGGTVAIEKFRRRQRAVVTGQGRLVVEQLQVAGAAGHEQEDHVFRPGGEMRLFGRQRIGRRGTWARSLGQGGAVLQEGVQSDRAEADAALLEEPATGEVV